MKKLGFTLAEVLITLVIIGVIAALTLGTVVSNTSKKQLESQTQKMYSQLSKAIELYMVDNNIEKFSSDQEDFPYEDFAFTYLKVSSKCEDESTDCFAEKYTNRVGGEIAVLPSFVNSFKLSDGSVVSLPDEIPSSIVFDVNGTQKPNKAGYDLWSASIHYDGRIDGSAFNPDFLKSASASDINDQLESDYETYCKNDNYTGCLAYFIRNGFKIVD